MLYVLQHQRQRCSDSCDEQQHFAKTELKGGGGLRHGTESVKEASWIYTSMLRRLYHTFHQRNGLVGKLSQVHVVRDHDDGQAALIEIGE